MGKGAGVAGQGNEGCIFRHELYVMGGVVVSGINIDGVCLNAIIRHLGHSVLRGEIALLHYQFIGISVIHAACAFEIIGSLFPAVHLFKAANGFGGVIIRPFRFQTGGRIHPAHFSGDYVFLGNGVAIYIFCLVGVKHVLDDHLPHGIHIAGGIVVPHTVSCHVHGVFCGNPAVLDCFLISIFIFIFIFWFVLLCFVLLFLRRLRFCSQFVGGGRPGNPFGIKYQRCLCISTGSRNIRRTVRFLCPCRQGQQGGHHKGGQQFHICFRHLFISHDNYGRSFFGGTACLGSLRVLLPYRF